MFGRRKQTRKDNTGTEDAQVDRNEDNRMNDDLYKTLQQISKSVEKYTKDIIPTVI